MCIALTIITQEKVALTEGDNIGRNGDTVVFRGKSFCAAGLQSQAKAAHSSRHGS